MKNALNLHRGIFIRKILMLLAVMIMANIFMGLNQINTAQAHEDVSIETPVVVVVPKTYPVNYDYPEGKSNTESLPTMLITQEITLSATVVIPVSTEELFKKYFPNEDFDKTVDVLSKVLRREAGVVMRRSRTNCAAVIWCILNRVDRGMRGNTPIKCATSPHQFCWRKKTKYSDAFSDLVKDVLRRWLLEKEGEVNVGRVLPKEYVYFIGKRGYNNFTTTWHKGEKWFTPKHSETYEE
jgi:hypothetical protein